ncbi:MAG: LD-carboxypeptidase [Legionellaceae bacterium]|nr:LD-carboxypeptidase [Legionellaceae bacterium]MBP9775453.1 LD-carboxypeptidase [Legionellaceae bacterium]
MLTIPILKAGDKVEIIAPASRCSDEDLTALKELLTSWQLHCVVKEHIFGQDLLCANSDKLRFESLKNALLNPETKAVICARGGYGSQRLIPELAKISSPSTPKLFIGMSDITALHLFLQQTWQWPVVHGALAPKKLSLDSIAAVKSLIFGETDRIEFHGEALNLAAKKSTTLESTLTGGNLSLVQTSIGTIWQMDGREKIIFLEDVGERGYRIDRMLEHLRQSGIFKDCVAIILGDFTEGTEPNGTSLINPVLERFASACEIPVIKVPGIGHDPINHPLPFGTKVRLALGDNIKLTCMR